MRRINIKIVGLMGSRRIYVKTYHDYHQTLHIEKLYIEINRSQIE